MSMRRLAVRLDEDIWEDLYAWIGQGDFSCTIRELLHAYFANLDAGKYAVNNDFLHAANVPDTQE